MFWPIDIRVCSSLLPCYLFFLRLEYIINKHYIHTTHTHTPYIKRLALFLVPLVTNPTKPYFTRAKRVTNSSIGGACGTN